MTNKQIKANAELYVKHTELKNTDYKLLKHLDGEITAAEYEPIKAQRAALRASIRELEAILGGK